MKSPSIAVIGAGVAGLSAALGAAELGCEVTVIERDRPAAGSSGRSAGVFSICTTDPVQVEVRVRARELLERFEREDGLRLERIGYVRLARSEAHVKTFEKVVELQRQLGVEPARLVDPAALRELAPHLRTDDLRAALHSPDDGCMDGRQLCAVLARRATRLGCRLLGGTQIVGCERVGGRHRLLTGADPVEADVVVNAAGPWATQVGELLGHPLPLFNQVNEVFRIALPPSVDYPLPMIQEYIPGEERAGYFRQDGATGLIAGMHSYAPVDGMSSADPDGYGESVAWASGESVARHLRGRLQVEGLRPEPGWAGLYPIGADGEYVVGPYEADPSVIACGGFGGQGLNAAVSVGLLVAEWIVHGEPRSLPAATGWRPDRSGLR